MRSDGGAARRHQTLRDLVWLLGAGILLMAPGLGLKDPWPPDEPRYVLVASEMLASGDWLVPVRAGEIYPDKPPVFFWIEALLLALTGSIRLAHQLPSLLASLLTLGLTYDLGRRLWNRRVGLWAGGILAISVQLVLQARSGQIDATLAALVLVGLYGLLRHALLGPAFHWYLIGWGAMGLGIVTKGVGFLPVLVLLPLAWAHGRDWRHLGPRPDRRWWLGVPVMLLVIAGWLVPLLTRAATRDDPRLEAYVGEILFRQTATRYAQPWGHQHPFWYYLVEVIPWLWLPVTLALPWLVPAWRARLARRDARYLVLLGWLVLVLLFFSLSPGKRGVYVLPALPAFALAAAPLAPGLWRSRRLQQLGFVATSLLAVALAAVIAVVARPGVVELGSNPEIRAVRAPLLAAAGLSIVCLALAGPRKGLAALVGLFAGGSTILGLWVYPVLDPYRSGRGLMQAAESHLGPGEQLAIVDWREQMMLQATRPVHHFGFRTPTERDNRLALGWLQEDPRRRLLIPHGRLTPCFSIGHREPVFTDHESRWYLLDGTSPTGRCQPLAGPVYEYAPRSARRAE
jgi:4-amino-4-deoxy-L-arabinose transferase-like glycosyltransferase